MALILSYIEQKKWSYLVTLNGALTGKIKGLRPNYYTFIPKKNVFLTTFTTQGMVSQCAGCNVYEPWAGLVIGMMAGCVYFGVSKTMVKCGKYAKLPDNCLTTHSPMPDNCQTTT